MNEILNEMLIWLTGFVVISATCMVVARCVANQFRKKACVRLKSTERPEP